MALGITFKMNVRNIAKRVLQDKEKIEDLRPYWRYIWEAFIINEIHDIFRTDGRGTWAETQRPNPILRDTLQLFRSLTRRGTKGNINIQRGHYFRFGSATPYLIYHEQAEDRIRRRPVIGLLERDLAGEQGNQQLQGYFEEYFFGEDPDARGVERFTRRSFGGRRLRFSGRR